jgi:hypothetical protein
MERAKETVFRMNAPVSGESRDCGSAPENRRGGYRLFAARPIAVSKRANPASQPSLAALITTTSHQRWIEGFLASGETA